MNRPSQPPSTTLETRVSSKGQVTLPAELRRRLGLEQGSVIRFNVPANGPVEVERALWEIEEFWELVDAEPPPKQAMSVEEMDAARARRRS